MKQDGKFKKNLPGDDPGDPMFAVSSICSLRNGRFRKRESDSQG